MYECPPQHVTDLCDDWDSIDIEGIHWIRVMIVIRLILKIFTGSM